MGSEMCIRDRDCGPPSLPRAVDSCAASPSTRTSRDHLASRRVAPPGEAAPARSPGQWTGLCGGGPPLPPPPGSDCWQLWVYVQLWGPCAPSRFFGARPWDWCSPPVTWKRHRPYLWDGIYGQPDTPAAPLGTGRLPVSCLPQEARTGDCGALRGLGAVGSGTL